MPEIATDVKSEVLSLHSQILDTVEKYATEIKSLDGRIETTVNAKLDKLNARLDDLEIKHLRPAASGNAVAFAEKQLQAQANPKRKEAFERYLRKGREEMSSEDIALIRSKEGYSPEQLKMLTEGDAQGGGFFVVPEYVQDIVKAVVLVSTVRQYAKIRTTKSNSVKQPKRTQTAAATWTAEANQQTPNNTLRYGMDEIGNHGLTAILDISLEDLEDSMFDMATEISTEISEQFAKAEGAAFINGSGKGQPEGILTNSAIAFDMTGATGAFSSTGDEFVTCAHNIKSQYVPDLVWFLNRQSIGKARLLKDTQGRPIWLPFAQAGLQGVNAPTIVGIPYAEQPDCPNVATGAFPVLLGAWRKAYLIVDRLDITMQRDPYILGDQGAVRFRARKRVGGQVILTEAIRKIKVS